MKDYQILKDYRYERKFLIEGLSKFSVEQLIRNHSAFFKEIYKERYINNIYFDNQNLTNYYDNVNGKSYRKKYRIRWYGNLFGKPEQMILEVKIKKGLLGSKESYLLKPFDINSENFIYSVKRSIENSDISDKIKEEMYSFSPVLINRYKRKYFSDFSKRFRITLDFETEYYSIMKFFNEKVIDNNQLVVELKYRKEHNNDVGKISSEFPFRMTKNSKYVNGIEKFFRVSI